MSQLRRRMMMARGHDSGAPVGNYIEFADPVVKAICVANWGSDGELTYEQAAAVTSIGTVFKGNTEIVSFDEFKWFTGLSDIGNTAFQSCTALQQITLPNAPIKDGGWAYGALSHCTALERVTLSEGITTIAAYMFFNDSALASIEGLERITTIKDIAFQGAFATGFSFRAPSLQGWGGGRRQFRYPAATLMSFDDLGSITTFPNDSSGNAIFTENNISRIVLPATMTSLGSYPFYGCYIDTIVSLATTPPTATSWWLRKTPNIYVPDESVDAYKAATKWSDYASTIYPLSSYTESL